MQIRLDEYSNSLLKLHSRIQLSNPFHLFEKGFALVSKEGKAVTSIQNLAEGDSLTIRLADGTVKVEVTELTS